MTCVSLVNCNTIQCHIIILIQFYFKLIVVDVNYSWQIIILYFVEEGGGGESGGGNRLILLILLKLITVFIYLLTKL